MSKYFLSSLTITGEGKWKCEKKTLLQIHNLLDDWLLGNKAVKSAVADKKTAELLTKILFPHVVPCDDCMVQMKAGDHAIVFEQHDKGGFDFFLLTKVE